MVEHKTKEGSKFAILTWHRIESDPRAPLYDQHCAAGIVTKWETFISQLDELERCVHVIRLGEALTRLGTGTLGTPSVVLTFDDGFAEHADLVVDELARRRFPSVLFVCGVSLSKAFPLRWLEWFYLIEEANQRQGRLRSNAPTKDQLRRMNSEARAQLLRSMSEEVGVDVSTLRIAHRRLFASSEQLGELARSRLIEVGGHSLTHPLLAELTPAEQKHEIDGCRKLLQRLELGANSFAYPFGGQYSYCAETTRIVREGGYLAACTALPGYNTLETSRFELKRFDMNRFTISEIIKGLS